MPKISKFKMILFSHLKTKTTFFLRETGFVKEKFLTLFNSMLLLFKLQTAIESYYIGFKFLNVNIYVLKAGVSYFSTVKVN